MKRWPNGSWDAFVETPGLEVSLKHDGADYLIPTAVLRFGKDWQGPPPEQVAAAMQHDDPPIYLHQLGPPDQWAWTPKPHGRRDRHHHPQAAGHTRRLIDDLLD